MIPRIEIDGEFRAVNSVHFLDGTLTCIALDDKNGYLTIWNDDENDLTGRIVWGGRYKPVHDLISNFFKETNDELTELAKQLAAEYSETGYVNPQLSSEYHSKKEQLYGIASVRKKIFTELI